MKKKLTILLLFLGLLLTGYFLRQSWFARYEAIELPVLPGYTASSASMINNKGYILGGCSRPAPDGRPGYDDVESEQVIWDPDLEPVQIPSIDGWVHAFNDANQIACTIGDVTSHQACVYDTTHGFQMIDIPDVTQTWASDINNQGVVLVYGTALLGAGATTEMIVGWDLANATEEFRITCRSSPFSLRINDRNQVGGLSRPGREYKGNPFSMDPDAGYTIHTDIEIGTKISYNNNGTFIVMKDWEYATFIKNGKSIPIRSFLEFGENANLGDLNNKGQVVGCSHTQAYIRLFGIGFTGRDDWYAKLVKWYYSNDPYAMNFRAFLWQDGTTYDLNDLIPSDSGWFLEAADDINDHGEIVGWGFNPYGSERGFLLRPLD